MWEIDAGELEDCAAIARVHVKSWQEAYRGIFPEEYLRSLSVTARETSWKQVLTAGQSHLLVARANGNVLGFVSFGRSRDDDAPPGRGEIWALYVEPQHWCKGLGGALWIQAQDQLVTMGLEETSLWVLEANERALRFYRSVGFQRDSHPGTKIARGGVEANEVRLVRPRTV